MPPLPILHVQLLGSFRLAVDDWVVPAHAWRSQRAAALVKLLALAPEFRLHRELIADALWPRLDPGRQINNLNVSTTRARAALGAAGAPAGTFLLRSGHHLLLGPPELVCVDVVQFTAAVAAARNRSDVQGLEAALSLYRGDLLADDRYEAWAEEPRHRVRSLAVTTLARLAESYLTRREIDGAIDAFQRLLTLEPADEDATVALMRLYAGQGKPGRALAQYDRLVSALRAELDSTPLPGTTALANNIRSGTDPTPGAPDGF